MATKVKINDYGDCEYSEEAIIEQIYQNPKLDISHLNIESKLYEQALAKLQIDLPKLLSKVTHTETISQFDKAHYNDWHMPESYTKIDVKNYLLEKCKNEQERERVEAEYKLFETKGFIKVLQFLIYFVDTLRHNNVVWGVGRGSSVSSFCLFLIGVHKINPLIYDLDYTEFLR